MERIGLTASEAMSFENVDGRRMTDACIYYKLTYEPSDELKRDTIQTDCAFSYRTENSLRLKNSSVCESFKIKAIMTKSVHEPAEIHNYERRLAPVLIVRW